MLCTTSHPEGPTVPRQTVHGAVEQLAARDIHNHHHHWRFAAGYCAHCRRELAAQHRGVPRWGLPVALSVLSLGVALWALLAP